MTLTRAKFDELTSDLVAATETPVRQALNDADVTPSEIDQILLVGGSTRIIAVQESVKRLVLSLVMLKISYYLTLHHYHLVSKQWVVL